MPVFIAETAAGSPMAPDSKMNGGGLDCFCKMCHASRAVNPGSR